MIYNKQSYAPFLHQHINKIASGEMAKGSIPIGIKKIDDILLPIAPTDLGIVLANSGHGKSAFMLSMVMNASGLYHQAKDEYAPPIYITRETAIEELLLRMLANFSGTNIKEIKDNAPYIDWKVMHDLADQMMEQYPVIFVGHSIYAKDSRKKLNAQKAIESVQRIHDKLGKKSILATADYLQRFDWGLPSVRENMMRVVEEFKDLAAEEKIPLLLGCQAKREVRERTFPVPLENDGMETSNIEQTADWMVSLMRPIKYWKNGTIIPKSENNTIVTPDLFFINILKQRSGDTHLGEYCSFDMRIFTLSDLEL